MKLIEVIESLYNQYGIEYKKNDNFIQSGNLKINFFGEIYTDGCKKNLKLLDNNQTLTEFSDLEKIALSFVIAVLDNKVKSNVKACELKMVNLVYKEGYLEKRKIVENLENLCQKMTYPYALLEEAKGFLSSN